MEIIYVSFVCIFLVGITACYIVKYFSKNEKTI